MPRAIPAVVSVATGMFEPLAWACMRVGSRARACSRRIPVLLPLLPLLCRAGLWQRVKRAMPLALRVSLALFVWLVVVPYFAFWVHSFSFCRGLRDAWLLLKSADFAPSAVLLDSVRGVGVCGVIMFTVGVVSVFHDAIDAAIRHVFGPGGMRGLVRGQQRRDHVRLINHFEPPHVVDAGRNRDGDVDGAAAGADDDGGVDRDGVRDGDGVDGVDGDDDRDDDNDDEIGAAGADADGGAAGAPDPGAADAGARGAGGELPGPVARLVADVPLPAALINDGDDVCARALVAVRSHRACMLCVCVCVYANASVYCGVIVGVAARQVNFNLDAFFGLRGPLSAMLHNVLFACTFVGACIAMFEFIPYRGNLASARSAMVCLQP